MQHGVEKTVRLKDYAPPAFLVDELHLHFDLTGETVLVAARMELRRNPAVTDSSGPLCLDGDDLDLRQVKLNGRPLAGHEYSSCDRGLRIHQVPEVFRLETEVLIRPAENTLLEGLYQSGNMLCTQCEAEGFRRITYYPDRPDVLTTFTTTIVADKRRYPVLLSNGNPVDREDIPGGLHRAVWHDPFPKPCYLFALVAGELAVEEDLFVTCSGRRVTLRIYLEPHNLGRGSHALAALKKAMRWDEEVFGLEYDLDLYMIVAVDDFNAGAMENKGLNIFNSKYVLADTVTATDADFQAIEEVVAHEYFHNWTGNRVTCRDWFQLCLKEGLTVFRDQEFSADQVTRSLKRIQDVRMLRTVQFAEDAGPLAHPVRPEEYREINNFYTVTVYEKGAEIVRMLSNLMGASRFRQGLALYFDRFDGQAVTIEDFLEAMQEVSDIDLAIFSRWYHQAGTPCVKVEGRYDARGQEYSLTLSQACPPTPGQPEKQPFHIPVAVGLLDPDGREVPLCLAGQGAPRGNTAVLSLQEEKQTFRFKQVSRPPVPSLLRGFSAPVRLDYACSDDDLMFLVIHDSDAFNRWEAAQQLATRVILRGIDCVREGRPFQVEPVLSRAFREVLRVSAADRGLAAQMLTLPGENFLADQREKIDIEGICLVRRKVREALCQELRAEWQAIWQACAEGMSKSYEVSPAEVGRRSLKNLCLEYLAASPSDGFWTHALDRFGQADNMTDRLALLAILANSETCEGREALEAFYRQARHNPLVLDKWFAVQATARHPAIIDRMHALLGHPDFHLRNPNRVRAVLHAFARGNPGGFHVADGAGYALVADYVAKIDRTNPRVAATLAGAFSSWRRFDGERSAMMKERLVWLGSIDGLSGDVGEIVQRSLQD